MAMIVEPLPQLCKPVFGFPRGRQFNTYSGTEAGDQWLFKTSLLITVTKLVEVSQSSCIGLHRYSRYR
jgi:hypothetical protein